MMRLALISLILSAALVNSFANRAVSQVVTLEKRNATLQSILLDIGEQTGYNFLIKEELYDRSIPINIKLNKASLAEALRQSLGPQKLTFVIHEEDKTIIIKSKDGETNISESTVRIPVKATIVDITGRVLNESGLPVEGATVSVRGSNVRAVTDQAGNFRLANIAPSSVLIITSIGYKTLQVDLGTRTTIEIVLEELVGELEETVVIGYGTALRKDLTGSIASVSKEVLDNTTFSDLGRAIQGQIPGVHILTGDGSPGEEVQVTVRGIGSFLGDTSPLIVLDGAPMPPDFNLNDLNPDNIQSIDVLKGASASAIYGSRAASGVLMIETKQARLNQAPTINYSYNIGLDQLSSTIDVLTVDEWKFLLFEGVRNTAGVQGQTNVFGTTHWRNYTTPGFFREETNTNWQKEMMQASTLQTHNLSVRGGLATARYTASLALTDDQGIMKESGFTRYNINLGLDNQLSSKLSSNLTVRANFSERDVATASVYDALFGRPDYPAYNEDGSPFVNIYYLANGDPRLIESPLSKLLDNINKQTSYGIGFSGFFQYNLLKNLNIRSRFNYNLRDARTKIFYASTTSSGSGTGFTKMGSLTDTRIGSGQTEWENQLNYSYQYKRHKWDFTAVTSILQETRTMSRIAFDDFPDNHIQNEFYQGATYKSSAGYINKAAMMSYVGRMNYNYRSRYFLTASLRSDRSSKFAPRNAFGLFPSVALAWNVSQEPLIRKVSWINFLKLRGGIGETGMANVGFYAWRTLYGATNYNGEPGVIPDQVGNDDLRWENSQQAEVGVDFRLFNSRLRGTVEYYTKIAEGLLYPFTLAPSTGFTRATVNFAKVNNKGFDIDLQVDVLRKKDLTWTVGGNFNNNKNTVLNLDKEYITGSDGGQALRNTILKEGEPFGLIYGFKTDGIYKTWEQIYADQASAEGTGFAYQRYMIPGEIRYVDLDEDGYVSTGVQTPIGNTDRTILGYSLPKFSGGVSTFVNYKQWNLRVFGTYSLGNDKIWSQELFSFTQATPAQPRNGWKIALDRWTPENPDSKYPSYRLDRTSIAREFNDYSVHDASYLKIQNVQLLYDLNSRTLSKLKIFNKIQVYGSLDNVYTFTNYPGLNVESYSRDDRISGAAVDNSLFPTFRTFNFGIKTTLK